MDQTEAPMLDRLAAARREHRTGFGAPGHHLGRGAARAVLQAIGAPAFAADLTTPKGLDDRTETHQTVQRAHALGAKAWGGDMCRYTGAGSTQCLHILLAACVPAGGRVLVARNAHKAEWSTAVVAGYDIVPLPVAIDPDWDVEHGVDPATLDAALAAAPDVRAAVIVSPSYFGAVSDVAGSARVAHRHGVPLIVDAAWGAAFAFAAALPANPMLEGADAMAVSVHKMLGSLGGGAALVQQGTLIDPDRLKMAYELLLTTSPSAPVLASIDGARREHVLHGDTIWEEALRVAALLREELAAIPGCG